MENDNLDQEYIKRRADKSHSFNYRLRRRTGEVIRIIHRYGHFKIGSILDIGAAEGLMLSAIKKEFLEAECVGLEYSRDLIEANKDKSIKIIQGDAHSLPFENNSFDIAVTAAVIEHLENPEKMLEEVYRVLRLGGILILTTPVPFFDKISKIVGFLIGDRLLNDKGHKIMFNLRKLKEYFKNAGFEVLIAEKFMFSPCGFPAELKIETLIKFLKLDFVLLNQIIVGKK